MGKMKERAILRCFQPLCYHPPWQSTPVRVHKNSAIYYQTYPIVKYGRQPVVCLKYKLFRLKMLTTYINNYFQGKLIFSLVLAFFIFC